MPPDPPPPPYWAAAVPTTPCKSTLRRIAGILFGMGLFPDPHRGGGAKTVPAGGAQ